MTGLTIVLEGDGAFGDVPREKLAHGQLQRVCALSGGMESGKPSVALLVATDDGKYVLAETSMALFLGAADAFRARHGDPRKDDSPEGAA